MRPFRDGAPFLLLIETPQTFWVPVTFFPYCVSLFVTTVSYDNDRLLASILCIKLLHVTFVFCPHLLQHIPFLLVNFTSFHIVSCTPLCFATTAHLGALRHRFRDVLRSFSCSSKKSHVNFTYADETHVYDAESPPRGFQANFANSSNMQV